MLSDEVATLQFVVKETEAKCEKLSSLASRVQEISGTLDVQKQLYNAATSK